MLRGIAQGRSSRELAQAWGVSLRTVESQRPALFDTLAHGTLSNWRVEALGPAGHTGG